LTRSANLATKSVNPLLPRIAAVVGAAEYEALRLEVAVQFRDDRMGYTDAKTDFVIAAIDRKTWNVAAPACGNDA
jgi:hypothetical protein